MKAILVVDDDGINIKTIGDILSPYYKVRAANSAPNALKTLKTFDDIELIILDVIMPFITGYDMITTLKKDIRYTDIPVIFISELSDIIDEFRAFELGAVDYIRKPIIPSILLSRVNSQITLNDTITRLKKYILILEGNTPDKCINVDKLTHYGEDNQFDKSIHYDKFKDMIMFVVSELAEGVGDGKKHHQNARTQKLVEIIVTDLFSNGVFPHELKNNNIYNIINACTLHDIGIIGLPASVSLKTDKYTQMDKTIMQTHTSLGYQALESTTKHFRLTDNEIAYIKTAADIAHYHHESWDGNGYPEKLVGYEIPLCARIVRVVDVFNAMVVENEYNTTYTHTQAKDIIISERGKQFDPDIVDSFIRCFEHIEKVSMWL